MTDAAPAVARQPDVYIVGNDAAAGAASYTRIRPSDSVFTGANAPTTIDRFPRGEAVHYREHALSLGVPDDAILIESNARSTFDNINNTRDLLTTHGIHVKAVTLISRPYQQRRAYNIARKLWPEVDVTCSAQPIDLRAYLDQIGDTDLVINTIVADTQRLTLDHTTGHAMHQPLPEPAFAAYERLVEVGYTQRVIAHPRPHAASSDPT
jgi:uncharacterized SAM-binding protein YcdF (DUF218 family)